MNMSRPLAATFLLALSACASVDKPSVMEPEPLQSLYDSRLLSPDGGEALTLAELTEALRGIDVIFVGEFHGHNGAHLLQSRLQVALQRQRPAQLLSLEPFSVDEQSILDRYLAGEIGEATLIERTDAWSNYRASYRPLVEFARRQQLPVIAANAPADLVRCVGREGANYLDGLAPVVRQWVPDQPMFTTQAYRDKFLGAMSHGGHGDQGQAGERRFQAQLLRDNTMAAAILEARRRHPDHQVLHITGTFHSEGGLGTVAALRHRAPGLNIRVLTPMIVDSPASLSVPETDGARGDYLYQLLPMPPEYRDPDKRRLAMAERFARMPEVRCTPDGPAKPDSGPKT